MLFISEFIKKNLNNDAIIIVEYDIEYGPRLFLLRLSRSTYKYFICIILN